MNTLLGNPHQAEFSITVGDLSGTGTVDMSKLDGVTHRTLSHQ